MWLTTKDILKRFNFSKSTLARWIDTGYFPEPDIGGNGKTRRWKIKTIEDWESEY